MSRKNKTIKILVLAQMTKTFLNGGLIAIKVDLKIMALRKMTVFLRLQIDDMESGDKICLLFPYRNLLILSSTLPTIQLVSE